MNAVVPSIPFCVVVISGPSGSGKTTIVARLEEESPVKLIKAVSATTRPPRIHEVDGEHYHFLSAADFEVRRQRGDFLEYAEVFRTGYWYGTLKSELERARELGGWALLEIDVEGALNVMAQYPEAMTIFISTPSVEEFEQRLRNRGTENAETIARRVATAHQELQLADRYQYRVINDDLDRAVQEIIGIFSRKLREYEHDA